MKRKKKKRKKNYKLLTKTFYYIKMTANYTLFVSYRFECVAQSDLVLSI